MEVNKPVSISVVLIIALTIFFLFALQKYQESMDLEMELTRKQAQYENQVDYYFKLSDILESIKQKQDILEKIESALPSEFAFAPIIYFLQEKAAKSDLNIKLINFLQPEDSQQDSSENQKPEVKNVMFKVELQGNYQSLKTFLYALEQSARLFEVKSIAFVSPQSSALGRFQSASKSYDFSLDIETHTY